MKEINKKKRELEENPLLKGRKFVKLGELEEERVSKYVEEQKKKEEELLKVYRFLFDHLTLMMLISFRNTKTLLKMSQINKMKKKM